MLKAAGLIEGMSVSALLPAVNAEIPKPSICAPLLHTRKERSSDTASPKALRHRESHNPNNRSIALVNVQSRTTHKASDSSLKLGDECAMCGRQLLQAGRQHLWRDWVPKFAQQQSQRSRIS